MQIVTLTRLTLALVTLLAILSGCVSGPVAGRADATIARLDQPMTDLATALAGEDTARMRAAGRHVIAIYDAGSAR